MQKAHTNTTTVFQDCKVIEPTPVAPKDFNTVVPSLKQDLDTAMHTDLNFFEFCMKIRGCAKGQIRHNNYKVDPVYTKNEMIFVCKRLIELANREISTISPSTKVPDEFVCSASGYQKAKPDVIMNLIKRISGYMMATLQDLYMSYPSSDNNELLSRGKEKMEWTVDGIIHKIKTNDADIQHPSPLCAYYFDAKVM